MIQDDIKKFTGKSIQDGLSEWYSKNPKEDINDAESRWLQQRPYSITPANLNDMWHEFLRADGYSGTLNDMLSAYWAAPSRVIPTLAGTQYGTIDTAVVFGAGEDFNIEVHAATTAAATSDVTSVFCKSDTAIDFAQLQNAGGNIRLKTSDIDLSKAKSDHLDGKIHKYNFKRSGNIVSIDVDDVEEISGDGGAASSVSIGLIGAIFIASPTQPFQGQILSTKFTNITTSAVRNFVFDSGSTTEQYARGSTTDKITLVNFAAGDWGRYTLQRNITHDAGSVAEAWVGADVVVNGGFDTDTDWTKGAGATISGGLLSYDGSQAGNSDTYQNSVPPIIVNQTYLNKYSIVSYSAGNFRMLLGNILGATPNTNSVGSYSSLATVDTSTLVKLRGDIDFIGSIDNVSVQHLLEIA